MVRERPTCRECACTKVCEYFENENGKNLDEVCPLCNWEKYFVPKREWISVDERLPEIEGVYLAYTTRRTIEVAHFYPYYVNGKAQFDYWISHWMPLPEPPETKGETE
jgi:hypothetical protein